MADARLHPAKLINQELERSFVTGPGSFLAEKGKGN